MAAQRMSNADAAWLHMDRPTNLMVVNAVLWFHEALDEQRAREIVQKRLVERFPRFRRRIAEPRFGLGLPSWEDDPAFDLDHHIHRRALPPPGGRHELEELVSDLMTMPLDRSKPLWDMYVVHGYGDGTALITRMHHAIADGIALARVLLSLTDEQPDAGFAPADMSNGRHGRLDALVAPVRTGAHLAGAGLHESLELLEHPRSELPRLADGAKAVGKLLLTSDDVDSMFRGEPGVSRRATWSEPMPLDPIKDLGHSTGTTVNDVLVAALSGALHDYLAERDALVDEIRAMVPFNLRPLDQPLPRELGNRFGLVYLSLPVGIADRGARLAEVHRQMESIKHSPEAALSYGILGAIGMTPVPVERRLIDMFTPKVTAVLTNVPGPRAPVYFAGTEVAGVLGWVPASGKIGLGISIFSYNGSVVVGLQVDPRLVPDPGTIVAGVEREVEALTRRAGSTRAASRST